jgi:LptD protein
LLKRFFIFFTLLFVGLTCLNAQIPDSILKKRPNNILLSDSITKRAVIQKDTPDIITTNIVYSKDSLEAIVDYGSKDSLVMDNVHNLVHLYGAAYVNYQDLKLTAHYIVIDLTNNIATAQPFTDSLGKQKGIPNFKDKTQEFNAKKMRYNFRTQKGVVYDVTTKYNDAYVHGGLSKFVGAKSSDTTKQRNDVAYSTDAIFTTCSADHPHFGIHSTKQKVIPNKLIVVGPSNLVIGDIPTPIWLPFAAFPLAQGKKSGLIFPRNYQSSPLWGFGFENMGWYFPISDSRDLTVTGDIYVRGTWGVRARSNYVKTYKNSGNFEIGYRSIINENEKATLYREPSWSIQWTHSKDSRSNPLWNFNANVNMQGSKSKNFSNYQGTVNNDFQNATRSTMTSSIGFTRNFPGKPYSLTGGMNASQNVATRDFTASLPDLDFRVQTIFPFKREKRVGEEKWFEKVSFQYSSSARSRIQTKDSLLFNRKVIDNWQQGIKHDLSTNVNFNVLKYFNFSPSISYNESWYFKQFQRTFDPTKRLLRTDTLWNKDSSDFSLKENILQDGKVDTVKKNGFYRVNQLSMGASLSTRIFGTMQFKKGYVRGIRHVITPSIGYNFSPNYKRYQDSVRYDNRDEFQRIYNLYENAIFGTPSNSGLQSALTYSFTNLFELKTYNKKDSTFKKTKLLENVSVAGSYNMAADSFKFSQIAMGTGTNFFNGLMTLSVNALFDPYAIDAKGNRLQELSLKHNGKLIRMVNATINLNTSLSIGDIRKLFEPKSEDGVTPKTKTTTVKKIATEESFLDLLESFRLQHNFSVSRSSFSGRDTTIFSNALYTSGSIPLSKKWKIQVGNIGYDFVQKQMTYPDFGFFRDLHCWEMGMNYQPLRGTYSFFLRVKPGTLDFLKLPYNKNIGDAFRR